jgi:hypothetical protein
MRREAEQLHLTTSQLVQQLKEEERKPMADDNPFLIAVRSYLSTIENKIPDQATRKSVHTVSRIVEQLEDGETDEDIAARDIAAVIAVLS